MAQGIVTYLGGATRSSQWMDSLANPAKASWFFTDCFDTVGLSGSASENGGLNGRVDCVGGSSAATTTSLAVLANAPESLSFEAKGAFTGTGVNGVVGLAVVAANASPVAASTQGAYFTVVGGEIVFRVRNAGGVTDTTIGTMVADADVRLGFEFKAGTFAVYVDGAIAATVDAAFPTGNARLVAGNNSSGITNHFDTMDYALVSVER